MDIWGATPTAAAANPDAGWLQVDQLHALLCGQRICAPHDQAALSGAVAHRHARQGSS